MSFVHKELVQEIRYYEAKKDSLEVEDLLRGIFSEKPLYKAKIKEIEERIEKLTWSCIDIM